MKHQVGGSSVPACKAELNRDICKDNSHGGQEDTHWPAFVAWCCRPGPGLAIRLPIRLIICPPALPICLQCVYTMGETGKMEISCNELTQCLRSCAEQHMLACVTK